MDYSRRSVSILHFTFPDHFSDPPLSFLIRYIDDHGVTGFRMKSDPASVSTGVYVLMMIKAAFGSWWSKEKCDLANGVSEVFQCLGLLCNRVRNCFNIPEGKRQVVIAQGKEIRAGLCGMRSAPAGLEKCGCGIASCQHDITYSKSWYVPSELASFCGRVGSMGKAIRRLRSHQNCLFELLCDRQLLGKKRMNK